MYGEQVLPEVAEKDVDVVTHERLGFGRCRIALAVHKDASYTTASSLAGKVVGWVRGRLERATRRPVNVNDLERRLQLLQQDDRIRAVNAALIPGSRRGESVLRVQLSEAESWRVRLEADNHGSPAIGSEAGALRDRVPERHGVG